MLLPWVAALLLLAGPAAAGQAVVQWEYGYVNVRSAPDGRKVDRLDRGARVETLESRGKWVHIRYDGRDGWVVARSLRSVEPPPAREPSSQPAAQEAPAAAELQAVAPPAQVQEEPAPPPPRVEPPAREAGGSYLAEYLDRPQPEPSRPDGAWLQILSGLFLVLALIGGAVWVVRMVLARRPGLGRASGGIRVLATRPLGPRQGLLLVEAGGLVWLLAQGPEGVRPIAEIRDADALKRLNERYGFLESPFEAELRKQVDLESEGSPPPEPTPEAGGPTPEERLAALRRRPRPGDPT